MNKLYLKLAIGIISLNMGLSYANAACEAEFLPNMKQMTSLAKQCGVRASLLASIGTPSGAISFDDLSTSCRAGQATGDVNQLDSFNDCARVYVCGVAAYNYAIEHADESGGDCNAAARAGLTAFPVQ